MNKDSGEGTSIPRRLALPLTVEGRVDISTTTPSPDKTGSTVSHTEGQALRWYCGNPASHAAVSWLWYIIQESEQVPNKYIGGDENVKRASNFQQSRVWEYPCRGEPWLVGKDVAAALGYGNGKSLANAVANHVKEALIKAPVNT